MCLISAMFETSDCASAQRQSVGCGGGDPSPLPEASRTNSSSGGSGGSGGSSGSSGNSSSGGGGGGGGGSSFSSSGGSPTGKFRF